jgi:hypothetical protein
MNPDDLARILDELGRRLGPAGEHVFALAVRQQIIEGIVWVTVGLLLIIAGVVAFLVIRRQTDSDGFEWLAGGILWVVAAVALIPGLLQLLNPEYAAIRDLLKAVAP